MWAGQPGQPVGEGGGAVAGVEDEQRRGFPAVPGGAQAAQHVPHLRDRLGRAIRGRGACYVQQGGPRGAQVPDRCGELVLPAGRGLAGPLAVAGAVVHVLPARGAPRVRPRVGGRVDREPQAAPPGARVPDRGRAGRGQAGQRFLQQPAVDHVVLRDPRARRAVAGKRRQRARQQGEEPLVVDSPGGLRVVQGTVAAGELRLQAQLHQRRHRVVRAQHGVREFEQGIGAPRQAVIQPGPELPQPLQRPVTRDRGRESARIWILAGQACRRQGLPGSRQRLQPGTRPWQGMKHGRFLSRCRMRGNTQHRGDGRSLRINQIYERIIRVRHDFNRIQVKS